MTGFTSTDNLKAQIASGSVLTQQFWKQTGATGGANTAFTRFWTSAGGRPGAGSEPATTPGAAYTNATGAITFPDVTGKKYILSHEFVAKTNNSNSTTILYDRLVAVSQTVGTIGSKTINSVALPRYTDGIGIECWAEVAIQGAGTSLTMFLESYTSDSGSARVGSNVTFSTSVRDSCFQIPLRAGDLGVKSVESMNVVSSATGVTVNLVLLRPILTIGLADIAPATGTSYTFIREVDNLYELTALPQIYNGASLTVMSNNLTSAVAGSISGRLFVVYE